MKISVFSLCHVVLLLFVHLYLFMHYLLQKVPLLERLEGWIKMTCWPQLTCPHISPTVFALCTCVPCCHSHQILCMGVLPPSNSLCPMVGVLHRLRIAVSFLFFFSNVHIGIIKVLTDRCWQDRVLRLGNIARATIMPLSYQFILSFSGAYHTNLKLIKLPQTNYHLSQEVWGPGADPHFAQLVIQPWEIYH